MYDRPPFDVEHASTALRTDPFPSEWGRPPADFHDRANWIREHATRASRRNAVTRNAVTGAAALRSLQRRASPPSATLTGTQALATLEHRMRREWAAVVTRMRLRAESGDSRG